MKMLHEVYDDYVVNETVMKGASLSIRHGKQTISSSNEDGLEETLHFKGTC